jgi:hypothetical protein
VVPIGFFAAQVVVYQALGGSPWEALWLCHVSNPVLAAGLLLRSRLVVATALLWLVFGTGAWMLNVATGESLIWTSLLTHLGGLAVAAFGIWRLGFPAGTWISALALFGACQLLSRWLTPAELNLNLAHRVWRGWEGMFPSYSWYLVLVYGVAGALFVTIERLARSLVGSTERKGGQ